MALAAGIPAVVAAMLFLWFGDHTSKVQWTLTILILSFWFGFSFALRTRVVRPLQTISNLLAAVREGDFSIRARGYDRADTLGDVMAEVNALGATLQEQRFGAVEATALLGKVVEEIDVALFTFDGNRNLRLVNRAGERLLAQPSETTCRTQCRRFGSGRLPGSRGIQAAGSFFPGRQWPLGVAPHHLPAGRLASSTAGAVGSDPCPA